MSVFERLIIKLCDYNLNVEWIYYLPEKYRTIINEKSRELISSISSTSSTKTKYVWLYDFLYHFTNLRRVRMSHCLLSVSLHDTHDSSGIITQRNPECLLLKKYLEETKSKIDQFHGYHPAKEKFYSLATLLFDRFAPYKRDISDKHKFSGQISNAWLKCWELLHYKKFDIIPKNLKKDEKYQVFCNAEFPGSFIFAIHHYIKTKTNIQSYDWIANSLWPSVSSSTAGENSGIFGDQYGLYRKYKQKWLMDGVNHSGSVLDPDMLSYVISRTQHTIDLYTSDIGIPLDKDTFHLQEELETQLNLGQIIHGLCSLREGGTLVCKMFMFFTNFNQHMLFIVKSMFREFYITKPVTSRPGNSEIYIVGSSFTGYDTNRVSIDRLTNILFNFSNDDHNIHNIHNTFIEGFPLPTNDFYLRLVYGSYLIYGRQLSFIDENIEIAEEMWKNFPVDIDKTSNDSKKNYHLIKRQVTEENLLRIHRLKTIYDEREKTVQEWNESYPIPFLPYEDRL
jgi:hypothetical protein